MAKIALPRAGEKTRLPKVQEPVYLVETADGFLARVPESQLDQWAEAQENSSPMTNAERQMVDNIVQKIYGSKK